MGNIITSVSFEAGDFKISQNEYTVADLNSFITKFEKRYLKDLLGTELYDLFIASLIAGTPPLTPAAGRFLTIFNPIDDDTDDTVRRSDGMVSMIKGFVFFEYVRKQKIFNTISGAAVTQNETSREAGFTEFNIYDSYNYGVANYLEIQRYIEDNSSVYPEYNGVPKTMSHWCL